MILLTLFWNLAHIADCLDTGMNGQVCNSVSSVIPAGDDVFTASSEFNFGHAAQYSRLDTIGIGHMGRWTAGASAARNDDMEQWIKVDLLETNGIVAIITQGREDADQWVTSYNISYSNDDSTWTYIQQDGENMVFDGNYDRNTKITQILLQPVLARYVRLHPVTWYSHISLRWDVTGCNLTGCGGNPTDLQGSFGSPGYFNFFTTVTTCLWSIAIDTGFAVRLQFKRFRIDSCDYGSLILYDDDTQTASYCGSNIPSNVTLATRSVQIELITHGNTNATNQGFELLYEIVPYCTVQTTTMTRENSKDSSEKSLSSDDVNQKSLSSDAVLAMSVVLASVTTLIIGFIMGYFVAIQRRSNNARTSKQAELSVKRDTIQEDKSKERTVENMNLGASDYEDCSSVPAVIDYAQVDVNSDNIKLPSRASEYSKPTTGGSNYMELAKVQPYENSQSSGTSEQSCYTTLNTSPM